MTEQDKPRNDSGKPGDGDGKAAHSGDHGPEGRMEPGSSLSKKQDHYAEQTDKAQADPAAKPPRP